MSWGAGLGGGNVRLRDGGRPNGSDVKLQAALPCDRTSGAPLAAMHELLTLSVCKRRDAVRLAQIEPARPAGAAFGGLSASAASCAAPWQWWCFWPSANGRCISPQALALPSDCRSFLFGLALAACGRTSVPKPQRVTLASWQNRVQLGIPNQTSDHAQPTTCRSRKECGDQAPAVRLPTADERAQAGAWRTT